MFANIEFVAFFFVWYQRLYISTNFQNLTREFKFHPSSIFYRITILGQLQITNFLVHVYPSREKTLFQLWNKTKIYFVISSSSSSSSPLRPLLDIGLPYSVPFGSFLCCLNPIVDHSLDVVRPACGRSSSSPFIRSRSPFKQHFVICHVYIIRDI